MKRISISLDLYFDHRQRDLDRLTGFISAVGIPSWIYGNGRTLYRSSQLHSGYASIPSKNWNGKMAKSAYCWEMFICADVHSITD